MSLSESYWERELLSDLRDEIERGEVRVIVDCESAIKILMDAFPFDSGRLTWEAIPDSICLEPPPGRSQRNYRVAESEREIRSFWSGIMRDYMIDDEMEVLVFGDTLIDFTLRMKARIFTDHIIDIFSVPHHTFVFPCDASWCLNYSVSDTMFFGLCPPKEQCNFSGRWRVLRKGSDIYQVNSEGKSSLSQLAWWKSWNLSRLREEIETGRVRSVYEYDDIVQALEEAFPFEKTRLMWETMEGVCKLEARQGRSKRDYKSSDSEDRICEFWSEIKQKNSISEDAKMFVLGDSILDFALQMDVRTFTAHMIDLFSLPQHTYAFPMDVSWCLGYMFWDVVHFGLRP